MEYSSQRSAAAALAALIVLQLVMLTALYSQTVPHPPTAIPLFGIAPFLGASFAAAAAALVVGPVRTRTGCILSIAAALMALLSYGPQKYFDPQFVLIWPSVIAGQIAVVSLFASVFMARRSNGNCEQ